MIRQLRRSLLFLSVATLSEGYLTILPFLSINKVFSILLLAAVAAEYAISPRRMPSNAKNVWLAIFLIGIIPSVAASSILGAPPDVWVPSAITPLSVVLFYFLVAYSVRDMRDLDLVLWALVLGCGATAATAWLGVGRMQGGSSVYWERAGGLGGNPNLMALYSVTGLAIGFLLFQVSRSLLRRTILIGMLSFLLLALLASLSRAGLVSFLLMGFYIIARSRRWDVLRWVLPAIAFGLVLVFFFAPEQYFERMSTIGEQADDLSQGSLQNTRIRGWYWAIRAFLAYPITGTGLNTFLLFVQQHDSSIKSLSPHSSYLFVLSTMGLMGFIPWMAVFILTWLDFTRARRIVRRLRDRGDALLAQLDQRAFYLQAAFFAWVVAGLVSPFEFEKAEFLLFSLGTVVLHMTRERGRALLGAELEEPDPRRDPAHALHPHGPDVAPARWRLGSE